MKKTFVYSILAIVIIISTASYIFINQKYLVFDKIPADEYFDAKTTKLLHTIRIGDEKAARKQLKQEGLSLNIEGKKFVTPLLWSILNRDKPALLLALKLGADPDFRDSNNDIILYKLAGSKLTDYLKIMLEAGANPDSPSTHGESALFQTVTIDPKWDNMKLLIQYGADINFTDNGGISVTHSALYMQQYDIALWLIEHGADIYPYDLTGSNLATEVQNTISLHNGNLKSVSPNVLKLKSLLIQRGVKFPPLTPFEVRAMWQAGKQPDDGSSPNGVTTHETEN